MVTKFLLIAFTSAAFLTAAEFTASVSTTHVDMSESFSLLLTLKDTSPKDTPAITPLKKHFLIHSKQYSTNTNIVNGKVSSSITWKLSLTPQVEGVIQIPAMTVETNEGVLSTQPITLHVTKGANLQPNLNDAGLNITEKVSNPSPYKNEPFVYTALLTSNTPLYNVQTQKLQIEGAIVESLEESKFEERIINGVLLNVLEITYLITPLKPGSLTIPPISIQGSMPQKRKGNSSGFFNDDLDLFSVFQGRDRLKPFTLMTEEVPLNVQPAVSEITPWLPAKSLTLEEEWPSNQTLRVGEPFSRTLLIKAEGLKLSQLPHLEDLQSQNSAFKVYADKPEQEEKMFQGSLHTLRKEQYTIIPQKAESCVLPEISIQWWDTVNKVKKTSTIPARTIQILPATETVTSISEELGSKVVAITAAEKTTPFLFYSIIGILTLFLATALVWGIRLRKKVTGSMKEPSEKLPPAEKVPSIEEMSRFAPPLIAKPSVEKEKKEKLPDLNPT